jgi:5-methylcytosine-specific restriction endonuclease McrA
MDFFEVPENRELILRREGARCFYCLRDIDESSFVAEHVISRPAGSNGFRNVVAACRQCNNRKKSVPAEDYLRTLYREQLLTPDDFSGRVSQLESLKAGRLVPELANKALNATVGRGRPPAR